MAEKQQKDPIELGKQIEMLQGKIDALEFTLIELGKIVLKDKKDLRQFLGFLDAVIKDATEPASWADANRPFIAGPFEDGRKVFAQNVRHGFSDP